MAFTLLMSPKSPISSIAEIVSCWYNRSPMATPKANSRFEGTLIPSRGVVVAMQLRDERISRWKRFWSKFSSRRRQNDAVPVPQDHCPAETYPDRIA